ncbi:MAG: ThiF family adenylyltransferase [Thermogutta sp.]|nr:ThiF family adenylyltransferase [Thermogutta sp.]HPU04947.1 ThiF family adenylyltransferase [Thermogutta sp.]HQF13409.1 ThiF family adenylyltransferase [Thermogutta sp.]
MSQLHLNRYIRQVQCAKFGEESQQRLQTSRVFICGCGALGTTLANHLVRAGVGFVRLVDRDLVNLHNLHRQVLFDEADAAQSLPKAIAAVEHLKRINSEVSLEAIVADVRPNNIDQFAFDVDLILDATDNFETRFLLNDYSLKHKIPWIFAACLSTQGQVYPIIPGRTPCLRCLVPELPLPGSVPTCEMAGILGPVVGVVASIQAMEAMKILAKKFDSVVPDLIAIDLWPFRIQQIKVQSLTTQECPACHLGQYDYLSTVGLSLTTELCGQKSVQITPPCPAKCDLDHLSQQWSTLGTVERSPFFLRLRSAGWVLTLFPDGRAIIDGINDVALARSIYAQFVGM